VAFLQVHCGKLFVFVTGTVRVGIESTKDMK